MQFWIDHTNKLYYISQLQTQGYRSPAHTNFRRMVNQAVGK